MRCRLTATVLVLASLSWGCAKDSSATGAGGASSDARMVGSAGATGDGDDERRSSEDPDRTTEEAEPFNLNYTYLYYQYGVPTPFRSRHSQSDANTFARENPNLVVQTGHYSLNLDCDDMELLGYDPLTGSDYLTALHEEVPTFTPADLDLSVVVDGTTYSCTSAVDQTDDEQLVRLVESSRYVQRFDHLGLVFEDASGNVLDAVGRFELTAWPDRATFKLDFGDLVGVTETRVRVVSPAEKVHESVSDDGVAILSLRPHLDERVTPWTASDYVTEAYEVGKDEPLTTYFDESESAVYVDLSAWGIWYPEGGDRFDEYVIEVTNPEDTAQNIPLVFNEALPRPTITGGVMTLHEEDGSPSGHPVQISKNWHGIDSDTPHRGYWRRGYTVMHLEPGESRRMKLRVVYGYWGGAGAISHASLSLVGWVSKNWKWEESALGSWGESCTYNPSLDAGGAFMDDIRPSFTNAPGDEYKWTENVGGGDMLIYRDSGGTYRWLKQLKTAFNWVGPNMTEIFYSGVTDDDAIRVTYSSRAVSTLDYHRRFHGYRYEFLKDVDSPTRLVFHQMAADRYATTTFTDYYLGDVTGMTSARTSDPGGNTYKGMPVDFTEKWVSIDDLTATNGVVPSVVRGVINLSSTLNGDAAPVYVHTRGRSGTSDSMLFDFSAESVSRSYSAGDVIEGEFEFVMPPKSSDVYWGGDAELEGRLTGYGTSVAHHDIRGRSHRAA